MTKTPKNQSLMRWALFAVLTFTALIFARSVFNGFVSLDDETYILGNPYIRDFSVNGIKTIFSKFYFGMYHPITMLSYLIEYTLFGADPLPYHFVNVLLHLLNTLIVFRLAERLSEKKWTAVVVSLLFAVHPMHVESVAWVSERKDLLYALFYLLSLSLYVRYLKSDYKVKWYVFSGVFFILSLLSKPAAITLPVLLFAFDFYVARKWSFKVMAEKIPLLILSVAFGIMALSSVKQETYEFLATSYGVGERIAIISYNVAFYLVKLFAPLQLSAIYYYPNPDVGGLPWYYFASIPFLMILAFLIYKNRWYRREVIFAFAFFLITVSVMLQIVPNGLAVVCDRYTYVPYLGFFFVAGKWVADMIAAGKKKSVLVGFFTVTIIFSMIAWNRIGIWKNGEILMTDVIRKSPDIFHCYWMRGNIRNKSGNLKGALQDYNKTIGYDPSYHLAYSDRSTVRQALGDVKGAVEDLNKAI
ncbi:MAG: glycosyltransferase family 39 protein, partial [Crocinitomicaceae bacterium]|nr:glycosyltransferase family 39 protein [Crocinitomicaceae bacterium]